MAKSKKKKATTQEDENLVVIKHPETDETYLSLIHI